MAAKEKSELMKAMRARRKSEGIKEFRIYAPEQIHDKIKAYSERLMKDTKKNIYNHSTGEKIRKAKSWEVAEYNDRKKFRCNVDGMLVTCFIDH